MGLCWLGEALPACGELELTAGSVLLTGVFTGDQVIFVSFFCNNLLNLLICLSLTLRYQSSLTLSINFWHLFMVDVDKVDTSCDLHNSLCLALLPRALLMDLTPASRRSLSAFLIVFLVFSILIVVFNLMLSGTKPLVMYLSMKIL